MKTITLVARHLYFGLDPLRLRDAANRLLGRLPDSRPRATPIPFDALVEELAIDRNRSHAIVAEMVESGVLTKLSPTGAHFGITTRFREIARARIIEPLDRGQAQLLLTHCAEVAEKFNRAATRNKYEIAAIAVYGSYMSRHQGLASLELGVTGRKRAPGQRRFIGRSTAQTQGTADIRALFERLSGFIEVEFFKSTVDIPRPFSVIFRSDPD
ncbi:MAG: hypothetical protein IT516_06260 [Burkholderiales bacterium]|nr:hypothetical protein [Burkholderiales bacterium]